MSTLSKEEVISAVEAALSKQAGKAVKIEQAGSWYKIDGEKSVRFSELESMLADLSNDDKPVAAKKASTPKASAPKKAPAKKASTKTTEVSKGNGLTPKALWRAKLAAASAKQTLPRGF